MDMTILFPMVAQALLPVVLLTWLALRRDGSRARWALRSLLVGSYLVAAALAGLWLALPWYLAPAWGALFLLAAGWSFPRRGEARLPRRGWRGRLAAGAQGALALLFAGLALQALAARTPPGADVVELRFPFEDGTYLVANGGSRELLNAHLMTLHGERFRPWRGQSYGVDLVKLHPTGLRAHGVAPRELGAYAIFGEPLLAPCAGRVIDARDDLPDLQPPRPDRAHMTGNHLLLDCGGAWVLLAHLQQGSVLVRAGDAVRAGQRVARVGNTGNTGEPHLHLHAQRPGPVGALFSGEPLPIRFAGRYPVRNQRLHGEPAARVAQAH